MDVRVRLWRRLSAKELMLLNCGVREDCWESLGLQGDPACPSSRKSVLNIHWKDRCWSWNSNTLATWCEELTHLKRPWCWERLKAGGEGNNGGWDSWMASLTQWTQVWIKSGSWWWTGKPGMLQSMGSQRVRRDWTTELNWTVPREHSSMGVKAKRILYKQTYLEFSSSFSLPLNFNYFSIIVFAQPSKKNI